MRRQVGRAIVAGGLLLAAACGSDGEKPETAGEESPSKSSAELEMCRKELKAQCSYDDKETGCSSLMTAKVPLTSGDTWGDIEIEAGPYGGYTEWNEGEAFANPINPLESTCAIAAGIFMEPQSVTDDVLDLRGQDLGLYTVFRPACMPEGEKFPVITWGNGTCGQSGGYAALLATVASHGFVVIAPNSRWTSPRPPTRMRTARCSTSWISTTSAPWATRRARARR